MSTQLNRHVFAVLHAPGLRGDNVDDLDRQCGYLRDAGAPQGRLLLQRHRPPRLRALLRQSLPQVYYLSASIRYSCVFAPVRRACVALRLTWLFFGNRRQALKAARAFDFEPFFDGSFRWFRRLLWMNAWDDSVVL